MIMGRIFVILRWIRRRYLFVASIHCWFGCSKKHAAYINENISRLLFEKRSKKPSDEIKNTSDNNSLRKIKAPNVILK